jgi:DNA-binding MarR family transcriptional regulator
MDGSQTLQIKAKSKTQWLIGLVQDEATSTLWFRQAAVLVAVKDAAGPEFRTVRSLAGQLNLGKPAVSRALDALERRGLARRVPDPADKRSVLVELTDDGHKSPLFAE